MKHYIDKNKEIFGFELDGSQDHLITEDMKPISLEEIQALNTAKEDEYKNSNEYRIQEAKQFLASTDYKMTVDYFGTLSKEDQDSLIAKRASSREFIRNAEGAING